MNRAEILHILSDSDGTFELLENARKIREQYYGKKVFLHILSNAKSGKCPENCSFCSQSVHFHTSIPEYPVLPREELLKQAEEADRSNARKFCVVTATRGPTDPVLKELLPVFSEIKTKFPELKLCASLGLLDSQKAESLKSAGVDIYNHNLETSEDFFPNVCTTHTWMDRFRTAMTARKSGMEVCCGGIIGLGESDEDIVSLLLSLKELNPDSIPLNLFNPRPGTPLGDIPTIDPLKALRVLSLLRILCPDRDIRIAGGREIVLRSLQPLAIFAASSLFTNGYLTTPGQKLTDDEQMIRDMGYYVSR